MNISEQAMSDLKFESANRYVLLSEYEKLKKKCEVLSNGLKKISNETEIHYSKSGQWSKDTANETLAEAEATK